MIDLTNLTTYLFSFGFLFVTLIIVALLLAPTWEHVKWQRRQRRRRG